MASITSDPPLDIHFVMGVPFMEHVFGLMKDEPLRSPYRLSTRSAHSTESRLHDSFDLQDFQTFSYLLFYSNSMILLVVSRFCDSGISSFFFNN